MSTSPLCRRPLLAELLEGTFLAALEEVRALIVLAGLLAAADAHGAGRVTLRGQDANGHWFDLSSERGRTVAVTFGSRETQKEVRQINRDLARQVLVVCVVDLRGVPRIGRDLALTKIRRSDRPGQLVHLVDERGEIARGFGFDPRHGVDILIVDPHGRLAGHYSGLSQLMLAQARIVNARREKTHTQHVSARGHRKVHP